MFSIREVMAGTIRMGGGKWDEEEEKEEDTFYQKWKMSWTEKKCQGEEEAEDSATRCWNKMGPNFLKSCLKSRNNSFHLKVKALERAHKVTKHLGYFYDQFFWERSKIANLVTLDEQENE